MKKINSLGAIEFTSFKLIQGKSINDFIEVNHDIDRWLKKQKGFRSRHISQNEDGLVLDILFWDTEKDGKNSCSKLLNIFADSPIHKMINQRTVSWFVAPVQQSI